MDALHRYVTALNRLLLDYYKSLNTLKILSCLQQEPERKWSLKYLQEKHHKLSDGILPTFHSVWIQESSPHHRLANNEKSHSMWGKIILDLPKGLVVPFLSCFSTESDHSNLTLSRERIGQSVIKITFSQKHKGPSFLFAAF